MALPEAWRNGEVHRLPAILVEFSVGELFLTWQVNTNVLTSHLDDNVARAAANLARVRAECRAFSSWHEAAGYIREHLPEWAERFRREVAPLLKAEKSGKE